MTTQPEALRLADALEQRDYECSLNDVVKELRRLHEENETLRGINESFVERQQWWNARLIEMERRYMALVKSVADGQALQRPNITLTTAPAAHALLQQALVCLEQSETTVPYDGFGISHRNAVHRHNEATRAIRQYLEKEKQNDNPT